MSQEKDIERGRQAQLVLESPAYIDAMKKIKDEVYLQWQDASNIADREHLFSISQAIKRLEQALQGTLMTGALKAVTLQRDQSRLERIGNALGRY